MATRDAARSRAVPERSRTPPPRGARAGARAEPSRKKTPAVQIDAPLDKGGAAGSDDEEMDDQVGSLPNELDSVGERLDGNKKREALLDQQLEILNRQKGRLQQERKELER